MHVLHVRGSCDGISGPLASHDLQTALRFMDLTDGGMCRHLTPCGHWPVHSSC